MNRLSELVVSDQLDSGGQKDLAFGHLAFVLADNVNTGELPNWMFRCLYVFPGPGRRRQIHINRQLFCT